MITLRSEKLLLLSIVAVGATLRVHGLSDLVFDQDGLYTLRDSLHIGMNGSSSIGLRPLYYLMQAALLQVFEPSQLSLRLLPSAFGVIGIWASWKLGRELFGSVAGLTAAVLTAVSPWHLYASQFARYWTLVFLLASLTYCWLPRALRLDHWRAYATAAVPMGLGVLTHPTFAFPMIGVLGAVLVVDGNDQVRLRRLPPRAIIGGGVPLILAALLLILSVNYFSGSVSSPVSSRPLLETLRVFPAMVQWITVGVVTAAVLGTGLLLFYPSVNGDRQWGAMAAAGCLSSVAFLLIAGSKTRIYVDYGMSMLPLVFVSAGALVERLAPLFGKDDRIFSLAIVSVLVAGVLPGTVSHLIDGTRFDYRPAYQFIASRDMQTLVIGGPKALHDYYAAALPFEDLRVGPRTYDALLREQGKFWLISPRRRYGLVGDPGGTEAWIGNHCGKRFGYEGRRLDYRRYRIDIYLCAGSVNGTD